MFCFVLFWLKRISWCCWISSSLPISFIQPTTTSFFLFLSSSCILRLLTFPDLPKILRTSVDNSWERLYCLHYRKLWWVGKVNKILILCCCEGLKSINDGNASRSRSSVGSHLEVPLFFPSSCFPSFVSGF